MKGYYIRNNKIIINRELTILDEFVKDFLKVIKEYSDYLIVSGFVSIATGRVRGTEDVDILMPILEKNKFKDMFNKLKQNKFWCYQSDKWEEAYRYIKNQDNIRFAREGELFPNMEVIPISEKRKAKFFEFKNPQKIKIKNFEFKIPWIEFEIKYKELVLKSKKDLEDAEHLRTFFHNILNKEKFKKSEEVIKNEI